MRTPIIALALLAITSTAARLPFRPRHPAPAVDSTTVAFVAREGTRLAADVSRRDGSIAIDLLGQLWILPADGGEARAITDAVRDTAEDLDPSFSPDGRRILFQSDRPGGRSLWLIDAAGGQPARATSAHIPYYARAEAAWAPDGRRFVYVRNAALVIHDIETGGEHVVTIDGLPNVAPSSPSWSNDGSIAFVNGGRRPRVWRVAAGGGSANPITDSTAAPTIAAVSPSGRSLAFIAPDTLGRPQLWVQQMGEMAHRLTAHEDVARHRIRWAADERSILYSADGRLWRIAAGGGVPVEIPFVARVRFVRRPVSATRLAFPDAGSRQPARGFTGLALSPDARRIAMLALDSLWVWKPGDEPHAVHATGRVAHDLAWSPDSRSVAWSAGPTGEENLYVTDMSAGTARAVTALPGGESMPAWSPDGQRIAFMHAPAVPNAPWNLRVASLTDSVDLTRRRSDSSAAGRDLGPIDGLWMRDQGFVWAPDGRAIVTYANPILDADPYPARFRLLPLDGPPRPFEGRVVAPSFGAWFDSTFTYVEGNRLWRVTMAVDRGESGTPHSLGDDPALAASTARDGTVLYLSEDGLRLRAPDGRVRRLGWPLSFRVPAPPVVLIRNVHVIDGTGRTASSLRDLLLRDGRIVRIDSASSIRVPNDAVVLDANGRFAMPGLIDMHAHFFPESPPDGFLYHGVTTARDVGSHAARTAALRDGIDAGIASGPRVVLGGFFFHSQSGSAGAATGMADQMAGDSAGLDRAMRLARGLGAGYVKHRAFEDWDGGVRTIAAAHRYGLAVSGHCAHILSIVAAGIDGKEHSGDCFRDFGRIYSDFTQLYAAAGLWVDPTAGLYAPVARFAADSTGFDDPAISPWLIAPLRARYRSGQSPASLERSLLLARSRTAAIRAAGVPLVAGTDQGLADGIHWELDALVRAGLSPSEAIVAATSRAARVLGAAREIGTLEVGKRADLVIVDRNPLRDIANTRAIWRVIQAGRIVDREALLRQAPNAGQRSLGPSSDRTIPRPP